MRQQRQPRPRCGSGHRLRLRLGISVSSMGCAASRGGEQRGGGGFSAPTGNAAGSPAASRSAAPVPTRAQHYQLCASRPPEPEPEPELLGDAELAALGRVDCAAGRAAFFRTPLGTALGAALAEDDVWALEACWSEHPELGHVPSLLEVLVGVATERRAGRALRFFEGVADGVLVPPTSPALSSISSLTEPGEQLRPDSASSSSSSRPGSAARGRERKRRWSKRQLEQHVCREKEGGAEDQPVFNTRNFELQVADVEDGDSVRVVGTPLVGSADAVGVEDQLPLVDLRRASHVCET